MENKLGIYNLENIHGKFVIIRDGDQMLEVYPYYDNPEAGQKSYNQALDEARTFAKWHFVKKI